MKTISLNIARLKVKIATNYVKYYDYLNLYFGKIILAQDIKDEFDIEINADWKNEPWRNYFQELRQSNSFFEIGANAGIGKKGITTVRKVGKKKKVIFDFGVKDKKFYLNAVMRRKVFKDTIRYGILGKPQEDWFFSVTYPILYYPVFWYQEYFLHTHMLHGSAVELHGKGVVICGLEGIGKTSLALSLLKEQNSHFLSDNLIFYDNERIYPCYELIRIHKNEDSCLWEGRFEKVNQFRSLKDFYKPALGLKNEGIRPDIFIFPQFGSSFCVEEISKPEAINRAIILSQLPAELGNYNEYRNLYNLLDLHFNPWESQYKVLGDLLNSARCYIVGMPKSDGLKRNCARLKSFINNE